MHTVKNVSYGSIEPTPIQYHLDQVVVNENIHKTERETEEGLEINYIADATYYSYQEYAVMQDSIIATQKAINEEQDELIAELLEGI